MARITDIPNELLCMILKEVLFYDDGEFRRPSLIRLEVLSPSFWQSSTVLLVCKLWFEWAIALFYHTIIIRNIAQGQALEDVFLAKPFLAQFVRRVRIEGSWDCLAQIIHRCSNIEVVLIILAVRPGEAASKFRRSLRYINPKEVIIYPIPPLNNKKVRAVINTFADLVPKWSSLTKFEIPHFVGGPASEAMVNLLNALSTCPSLRDVFMDLPGREWPIVWNLLGNNPAITFHIRSKINLNLETLRNLPAALLPRLQIYVPPWVHEHRVQREPVGLTGPLSLTHLTSQPFNVWADILTNILGFSTVLPRIDDIPIEDPIEDYQKLQYGRANEIRKQLCLTCHRFNMVMPRILYGYPLFLRDKGFLGFVRSIIDRPSLGELVHTLNLDFSPENWTNVNTALCDVLPYLKAIRYFRASPSHKISFRAFSLLASSSRQTLSHVIISNWELEDAVAWPISWDDLPNLRMIDVNRTPDFVKHSDFLSPNFFSRVIYFHRELAEPHVLRLFSTINFSMLAELCLSINGPADFETMKDVLKILGQRLRKLIVVASNVSNNYDADLHNHCSNLRVLHLDARDTANQSLQSLLENFRPLYSLEELKLTGGVPVIETFILRGLMCWLGDLDLSGFPRLRSIHLDYDWPCSEEEIMFARVPKWAERLKRQYNVDIVGNGGELWRPRLQPRR